MSTISSSSSQYYAIPSSTTSATSTIAALPTSNSVGYLLEKANASAQSDTVTLSSAAQAYLNQQAGSTTNDASSFQLTGSQQQEIAKIVAKYQGAPLTQDTFNQLQDDLKTVGLAPSQLSAVDRSQAFNPNLEYLNAENGVASNLPTAAEEKVKVNAYITQLYSQLQAVAAPVANS